MKYLRNFLLGLGLLVFIAAALVWFLPARWAMWWIEPQWHELRLQRVHGTLWHGAADAVVSPGGEVLGRLKWRLSRRVLLGHGQVQIDLQGPKVTLHGTLRALPDDQVSVRALKARIDLALLAPYLTGPHGRPDGEWSVKVEHALLRSGWPMELQARAIWRDAVIHTRHGAVPLGQLQWQARAHGGVVQVHVHDRGDGPLDACGELLFSPLGWRLDLTLRSRLTDPALTRWLSGWATPTADGSIHIQRQGGLAGTLSAVPSSTEPDQHEP